MLKRLRSECLIDLDIVTDGPLLIKSGRMFATGVDMTAVRTIRNGRDEVYIPGSSLKGAMRAQAERISRTLADPGCCDPFRDLSDYSRSDGASCSSFLKSLRDMRGLDTLPAEEVYQKSCSICKLFGSLWQAGRLAFNDAHVQSPNPRVYERSNVGIDRRTGGAFPRALFEMEVVPPTTRFHTSLYLRNFELTVRLFWKFISKNWKFNFEEQRTFNAGSIVLWTIAHLADKRPENTIRKIDKSSNRRKYNTL